MNDVAVLIPALGLPLRTRSCLEAIRSAGDPIRRIVLVDAGSSEEEGRALKRVAGEFGAEFLSGHRPLCYSEANNLAAKHAGESQWLCLLNNDATVTPGWINALVAAGERLPNLGVLGNRHLFPDTGLLHHCGIALDDRGDPIHLHPHAPANLFAASFQRDVPAVTFACALIPRKVWEELGGLDPMYRNGCEDVDFCLRAKTAGYRIVYSPASTIYHDGQSTPGRTNQDGPNLDRLRRQHHTATRGGLATLTQEGQAWASGTVPGFRAGLPVQSGLEVHLCQDVSVGNAFSWAMGEMALALERAGARVSLPMQPLDSHHRPEVRSFLKRCRRRRAGRDVHFRFSHYWPGYMDRSLQGDINVEWVCSNFAWNPDAGLDGWSHNLRLNGYHKASVSEFNRSVLERLGVESDRIAPVSLGMAPEIEEMYPHGIPEPAPEAPFRILILTNSSDPIRYGVDLLGPALASALGNRQDVEIHVRDYGAWSGTSPLEEEWSHFSLPPVLWHTRFLSKPDLLKLYADKHVLVAPFRGEGFGMKIADALALGLPVLMPVCAGPADFEGCSGVLPLAWRTAPMTSGYDCDHYPVAEGVEWFEPEAEDLVRQLTSLPDRREELAKKGRDGIEWMRSRFSWDRAAHSFLQAVTRWQQERAVHVTACRRSTGSGLTVVIPTCQRNEELARTLAGYADQVDPSCPVDWVIVNDGGEPEPVEQLVASFRPGMDIELIHHPESRGPAAARNRALSVPRKEIVLITGDDVVPTPDFLREHVRAHQKHDRPEDAVFGYTDWHEDVEENWLTDCLTGPEGRQFNYGNLNPKRPAPFDRFYTSNVSVKWRLLCEEWPLFSTCYPHAAYEDVELGVRLGRRGLRLWYHPDALAGHLHPQTVESFLKRQRKAGRMLTVFARQRPCFMPMEHSAFLDVLDRFRCMTPKPSPPELNAEDLLDQFARTLSGLDPLPDSGDGAGGMYARRWNEWMDRGRQDIWEAANALALRMGMAEQWSETDGPREWAVRWAAAAALPGMVGSAWPLPPSAASHAPSGGALLPNSRLAYNLSRKVRALPLAGPLLQRFEVSPTGMAAREWLLRRLRSG